jgi:hypothetical protein
MDWIEKSVQQVRQSIYGAFESKVILKARSGVRAESAPPVWVFGKLPDRSHNVSRITGSGQNSRLSTPHDLSDCPFFLGCTHDGPSCRKVGNEL